MLITAVLCQLPVGGGITLAEKIHIFKHKPDFVCLPEYFLIPPEARDYSEFGAHYDENLVKLARWSNELDTTLIGGSVIEKTGNSLYNTSYVFRKGQILASYRKQFPTEKEVQRGIYPGKKCVIFEVEGIRISILICADVFHRQMFEKLGKLKADLIFIPTISPWLENDTLDQKSRRDQELFIEGARISKAYVLKVCGLGSIFNQALNGRSLVAAPWGIIWQVSPENELHPRIQNLILDIDELRDFRRAAMIQEVVKNINLIPS